MYNEYPEMLLMAAANEIMQTKPRLVIKFTVVHCITSIFNPVKLCTVEVFKAHTKNAVALLPEFEVNKLSVAERTAELYNITAEL